MLQNRYSVTVAALCLLEGVNAWQRNSYSWKPPVTCATTTATSQAGASSATSTITFLTSATYSIVTAPSAASTASVPTVDDGSEYIVYSTVPGYFLQDLNSTNASTFDYTAVNFGLINQTYSGDCGSANLTQWQRFNRELYTLNQLAPSNVVYKLLFIGRHGEGYHNAEESFVGTPAWNCYYAELIGNATATWEDPAITPNGANQALIANRYWTRLFNEQKIQAPQSYYSSPLQRCLQTADLTYANLTLPSYYPFRPVVKEFLREGISLHTCDHRSNATWIKNNFPNFVLEPTFTEYDEYWNGITGETPSAQDYRSKIALDDIFSSDPSTIVSITTHSGEGASLLRVLNHRVFSLVTGAIIPILVKAETRTDVPSSTTRAPWTTSAWCTNGPPLTSTSTGCVCAGGVQPTTLSPPSVRATGTQRPASSS